MTLLAKDGFYYTNGSSYVKTVILPPGADPSVWREITKEEKERIEMEDLENA